ncbi:hypothetical protein DICPUDRAFT_22775, partial [Dictyostelium purpureum]
SSINQPENESLYDVILGKTMNDDANEHYHTIQYNIKPKSLDTKKAVIKMNQGTLQVQHNHINVNNNEKFDYSGSYKPCKEIECFLIFENGSFRLERQVSSTLIKREFNNNNN